LDLIVVITAVLLGLVYDFRDCICYFVGLWYKGIIHCVFIRVIGLRVNRGIGFLGKLLYF